VVLLLLLLLPLRCSLLSEELHTPCSLRSCDIWVRKRDVVTFCQLEHQLRLQSALDVYVQLCFGQSPDQV
jgi:hypothetical protein